jgi:hypothetical protein
MFSPSPPLCLINLTPDFSPLYLAALRAANLASIRSIFRFYSGNSSGSRGSVVAVPYDSRQKYISSRSSKFSNFFVMCCSV